MPQIPERLFRDEAGAALERVARLEEENRRLRDEVELLRRGAEEPPPLEPPHDRRAGDSPAARAAGACVVFTVAGSLLAMTMTMLGASHHHHHHGHAHRRPHVAVPDG